MNAKDTERLLTNLGELADSRGTEQLTEVQRDALLPWAARGIIGNCGFKFWYEGTLPLSGIAEQFRRLGFGEAADACEEVIAAIFPGRSEPQDLAGRKAALAGIDWSAFCAKERVIFQRVKWDDLTRAIGGYVDAHPAEFAKFASR